MLNTGQKGNLVYWEVRDFKTTKDALKEAGFENFLPRNDPKAALIKALKIATKGDSRFYKRFADTKHFVRFAVVNPHVYVDGDQDINIDFTKELLITLDKASGVLTMKEDVDTQHVMFFEEIKSTYEGERTTINSTQLRLMLTRYIKDVAYGVSMRSRGGIYFIDKRMGEVLNTLKAFFSENSAHCKLYQIPVYQDEGSLTALYDATKEDLDAEVAAFIQDVRTLQGEDGKIPQYLADRRKEESQVLLEKIAFHESTLRNVADDFAIKIRGVQESLNGIVGGVVPRTLAEELAAL